MNIKNKTDHYTKRIDSYPVRDNAGYNRIGCTVKYTVCGRMTKNSYYGNIRKYHQCGCHRGTTKYDDYGRRDECVNRLRNTYEDMIQRCYNPRTKWYHNYGGRGISICPRWLNPENGQLNFIEDAVMLLGWKPGLTIERVDVNGNYHPDNVEFIPKSEQSKNRRLSIRGPNGEYVDEIAKQFEFKNSKAVLQYLKRRAITKRHFDDKDEYYQVFKEQQLKMENEI